MKKNTSPGFGLNKTEELVRATVMLSVDIRNQLDGFVTDYKREERRSLSVSEVVRSAVSHFLSLPRDKQIKVLPRKNAIR